MAIRRYQGRYPQATRDLYRLGLLKQYPSQREVIFFRDHGVNIRYSLKGVTPEKFRNSVQLFLEAAYEETRRYPDHPWSFARFEVRLSRTVKGRKSLPLDQTYTSGKHREGRIMVYGVPGGVPGETTTFLIDRAEQILDIPARYLGRVNAQRPYTVLWMEVCLRMGYELIVPEVNDKDKEDE